MTTNGPSGVGDLSTVHHVVVRLKSAPTRVSNTTTNTEYNKHEDIRFY